MLVLRNAGVVSRRFQRFRTNQRPGPHLFFALASHHNNCSIIEIKMSNFSLKILLSLKIDEDVKQYIESMKGNLTVDIEKEIKEYFDNVKQNLTDTISEDMKSFRNSLQEVQQFIANQRDNLNEQDKCGGVLQDCGDLKGTGCTSDMYELNPNGTAPFRGYCKIDDYSWTVIQRREDGYTNFYRGWEDYKNGFGDRKGDFWLGNEHIYKLTSRGSYQLRITLEDWNGDTRYATYNTFSLGNEASGYKLTIGEYSGTAGDSMKYNNGKVFNTKDRDGRYKCAQRNVGAWWYGNCTYSNLNGEYLRGKTSVDKHPERGVEWYHWKGSSYSLKKSEMMIRKQ
ncbi:Ryncolin-4,Angiopoietin-related protein 7,Angiopoietin-related protein 1,Ficolin-1-B,Techylectin-5A,Ficolin-2,Ryncolin-1,Tenascin-R,Fibrinogen-like protein 1,Angiopoietin-1,Tenascin-X,Fibrinogen C domain-containing protein 1-A,Ryncolin-3,Tenascin,Fibrinogen C domain-containing protein 1,Ryncolin-2,Angiopoietin-related protein 6,Angiopoietin-related protein 2,Ficolin-1-A,Ficolin-1,Fibrinogen C domain-containing protein 1-B,Angiopoietin-4 [Mytilus coruscus]|uniref:Fibrinogen C-terminal domain-containing protein n=1 Tax=Mytilus coruscus TaxID=42192 RepID=A0A6J8A755_MYTCO|nr:Ryncolin-4,Angiopoietin-related protein 7,Angiopoietin-related protein 1,Ficolin-1-B,Techylectin-5A,Ficolin-2,Ryncolin-1,Tenascin-R,Fibrinogen-like protein 1,Angiopoietin-1,Tenascin-X,Fibrinogen C domain-containing protein 1-A,Ryncolin-3,Tenascin,Fibrinogen C domain-containing protein 1,Ryncolin-2,Angiopoietin-related protein 6,Angiopoietin-related protein 2,Ficolin-1-A,Ficolin-1,Fibrinogen C domain-containing protein 1-B,Angiopoietin-4 [Mytilus coruscus]